MNVLIIRYSLSCSIPTKSTGQYRIYIYKGSMIILRDIIRHHINKSM